MQRMQLLSCNDGARDIRQQIIDGLLEDVKPPKSDIKL